MKGNQLLITICNLILPFTIIYGFYIIFNGDLSSGGGFHGGVLLSTSFLLVHFMKDDQTLHFREIIKIEKYMFLLLVIMGIVLMLTYPFIQNSFFLTLSLMALNCVIGFKVTIGLCGIMLIFIEEGSL